MATKIPYQFTVTGHKQVQQAMGGITSTAGKLAKVLGPLVLAGAMYKLGKSAISTAGQFEALKTRLTAMTGSVERGTFLFNKFNQVAATTPFAVKNVVEAGASLQAFGVDAENMIKPVSDLAAFMGLDIVEAAQSMGRAFAGGAGAADVLRERGILQLIKDSQGIEDLTKLTLPQFREALTKAMIDPQGGIAGATDLLAKTWQGKLSNMQDAWARLMATLGDKMLPFAKKVVTKITGIFESMIETMQKTDWSETLKWDNLVSGAGKTATALGKIFSIMWDAIDQDVIASAKKMGNSLLSGIGSALFNLWRPFRFFTATAGQELEIWFQKIGTNTYNWFVEQFNSITSLMNKLPGVDILPVEKLNVEDVIADDLQVIQDIFDHFYPDEDLVTDWKAVGGSIEEVIENLKNSIIVFKEETGQGEEGSNGLLGTSDSDTENSMANNDKLTKNMKKNLKEQSKLAIDRSRKVVDNLEELSAVKKAWAVRDAWIMMQENAVTAYKSGLASAPPPANMGLALAFKSVAIAEGLMNINEIRKAATGYSGQVTKPTMFLAGEAGAENVNITPLNGPNIRGPQNASQDVNISMHFQGNVMDEDYIVEEVIPMLKNALRRGVNFF